MPHRLWALLELEDGKSVEGLGVKVVAQVPVPELPDELPSPDELVDAIEEDALETGRQVSLQTFTACWLQVDRLLVERRVAASPEGSVWRDGFREVRAVTRAGSVALPRQLCFDRREGRHCLPGNAALPPHNGEFFTRGAQELACLLGAAFPSGVSARLFGWMAREDGIISTTHARDLAREHGARMREASVKAARAALAAEGPLPRMDLRPWAKPRRPRAWAEALDPGVAKALERGDSRPPKGVPPGIWERVMEQWRETRAAPDGGAEPARAARDLARLGPVIPAGHAVVCVDEVLVRALVKGKHLELRTAHIGTSEGWRCITGTEDGFADEVEAAVRQLAANGITRLTLLADGAKWIRTLYHERLAGICESESVLCWYHLRKKCEKFAQRMFKSNEERLPRLRELVSRLWKGEWREALRELERWRPVTRSMQALDELRVYLRDREDVLPDYRERFRKLHHIASSAVEKLNDLIVARREKVGSLHWSLAGADALAALRTAAANGEWDAYWKPRHAATPA